MPTTITRQNLSVLVQILSAQASQGLITTTPALAQLFEIFKELDKGECRISGKKQWEKGSKRWSLLPDSLAALYARLDIVDACATAASDQTPVEILTAMMADPRAEVRCSIAAGCSERFSRGENRDFDLQILEKLKADPDCSVRAWVDHAFKRRQINGLIRKGLMPGPSLKMRLEFAGNAHTSIAVLKALTQDEDSRVARMARKMLEKQAAAAAEPPATLAETETPEPIEEQRMIKTERNQDQLRVVARNVQLADEEWFRQQRIFRRRFAAA